MYIHGNTSCKSPNGANSLAIRLPASEGDLIQIGSLALKVLYTPGHTDDSYCLLLATPTQQLLFSGDTLLIRSCGRTDFQNGSSENLYHSLFDRLLLLSDDTLVYPGHDYHGMSVSTIGEERRFNPRLQVGSLAEFKTVMASLHLAPPKLIEVAVPANRSCGNA